MSARGVFEDRLHPASSCDTWCRWEVRVLTFGANRNGHRYPKHLAPHLVEALPGTPLGVFRDTAGHFAHRRGGLIQPDADPLRYVVGVFEDAWADARYLVGVVHLMTSATPLRRALAAMERDRRLALAGVSIHGGGDATVQRADRAPDGRLFKTFDFIETLYSVDFVGAASACEGAQFLRRLARAPDVALPERSRA